VYYDLTEGIIIRLMLKAKVRHFRRSPGNMDAQIIQSERDEITTLFIRLKEFQQTAGVAEPNNPIISAPDKDAIDTWDHLSFDTLLREGETTPIKTNLPADIGPLPVEDQTIALPSNGNTSNIYRGLEVAHRISTADDQLNHIRNLIAEKSFQYSHVIRVSPRKGVTTRSRAAVKKLNNEIADHCRLYTRCRYSLLILGAEPSILTQYKVLNPIDVVGSTAVINPNQPGSTNIKLSWIWQTSARNVIWFAGTTNDPGRGSSDVADNVNSVAEDLPSLLECM